MSRNKLILVTIAILLTIFFATVSHAYWVWTPKTGKWVNPKYAVKDTPKDQMDWAMSFFEAGEYKRALQEFQKLIDEYPNSLFSPSSQYYIGRSHEEQETYYHAFLAYQTTIDKYPFNERVDEIIERQYKIGCTFLDGEKTKIMGMRILPAMDKASEILEQVVKNAPYGKYADVAQFKLGEAYMNQEFFEEAVMAYQKILDDYPKSPLAEDAKYQIALATYQVSRDPYYDQEYTDKAIEEYERLIKVTSDIGLNEEAKKTLNVLRQKKAQSAFETANFYERTRHYKSALIYYWDIVNTYGDTAVAEEAAERIRKLEAKVGKDG